VNPSLLSRNKRTVKGSSRLRDIIVICASEFSSEAQPRLEQARTKGTFWQRCTSNFLGDRTNYKAKDIIGKITNLFCIYIFQIDKLIHINIFFCICVSAMTMIGFVGFVANLQNKPTNGATISVRKSASKKELLFVRL
jgi:hypothetical protein